MERQTHLNNQESRNALERKLNIKQSLNKIGHNGMQRVPFDLLKFETQLAMNKVDSCNTWYMCLKEAVTEKLRNWLESSEMTHPHMMYYSAALDNANDENAWYNCYLAGRKYSVQQVASS